VAEIVRVGAVAYDPKVVMIWEAMREYFRESGVPTDYVLFSNYEAQVDALFEGSIDIAWNTNVAFVRSEMRAGQPCQILGMRNTDLDFTTRLVARKGSGVERLGDLKGRRLAVGSADSAQAAIVPLHLLRMQGLLPERDVIVLHFDVDVGKHGDTGTSEIEALRAVRDGVADACVIGHTTWLRLMEEGSIDPMMASAWTSPPYDHCNFTALPGFDAATASRWSQALLAMSYSDTRWRRLMELEGLTSWVPGRREGYELLFEALKAE
jgi:ABC-type phosphate/phosphonate transport system substrate-binding protein